MGSEIVVFRTVVPKPPLQIQVSSYDGTMAFNIGPMLGFDVYTVEVRGYVQPKPKYTVTRTKRKGWLRFDWDSRE